MKYTYIIIAMLLIMAPGCKSTQEQSAESQSEIEETTELKTTAAMMNGTVRYIDLEGGFYGIEADDGTRFYPINLSGVYKEDGMEVRFSMRPRNDIMTIAMWGAVCEIIEIEKR